MAFTYPTNKLKLYLVNKVPVLLIGICCSACSTNHQQPIVNGISNSNASSARVPIEYSEQKITTLNQVESEDNTDSESLNSEFETLKDDADDLKTKVTSLATDVEEIAQHRGDVSSAASDAQVIVSNAEDLQDKVNDLQARAESDDNSAAQEIAMKCSQLESSVDSLLTSAKALNDSLDEAETDSHYRHHEGIAEIPDNVDDVESKMNDVNNDAE